ncbi:MAG: hypothetical protein ACFFCO_08190 [Promethearchaeota archaeon]
MFSVDEAGRQLEELYATALELVFMQSVGLPYDQAKIVKTAVALNNLCEKILEQPTIPRLLRLSALNWLSRTIAYPYLLRFTQEYRNIAVPLLEVNGDSVNLLTWRNYRVQTENWAEQRMVFDFFVEHAPKLIPTTKQHFSSYQEIHSRYNETVLDTYLEHEQISYPDLVGFITKVGENARKPFLQAAEHYCQKIKGESFAYWDDFIFLAHRTLKPLNAHFKELDPLAQVIKIFKHLGFPMEEIKVDSENRSNKAILPSCFSIRLPGDTRIAYRPSSKVGDLDGLLHEFGHGIHGLSSDPDDPFWKREHVPMSVLETFSFLFEGLLKDELFLTKQLKLEPVIAQDIVERLRANNLYFRVFLAANSLMKLAFWKEGLSFDQASQRWQELTRRFYIEVPGDYWLLYPINVQFTLYNPSYLMAYVRSVQLRHLLVDEFGETWWEEPRAGTYIAELAATRAEFPIKEFPLDPDILLK